MKSSTDEVENTKYTLRRLYYVDEKFEVLFILTFVLELKAFQRYYFMYLCSTKGWLYYISKFLRLFA
ncbi:hypothetical protein V1478_003956 [Vespula squamosa]|uniref:Uncharacterized protein n=1 Tax=Vespula squamosa TaxID=30214 RepID=A0ABD2BNA3_VESSQ